MAEFQENNNEIRTLLEAFQLVGARVVLFLPSIHVEGLITRIGANFVTLRRGNGEGVEVESNNNGNALENPNQISVAIRDILAVSDDRGA
ncbi:MULTISPECIES: hypothetical protein [Bacillus cereus group]|jgi:hypothetical protein|uniref:hypothetical protein n=1 Tax=Bacillus cereus group TaxID=86661 RepID=UPI000BEB44E8|nr:MULTISPECIES: hypothetical protein [Bacillus cereus group]NIL30067.1 hypothetical protein [Bacillus thuringiensis]PEB95524.1 hypothetical protein CON04_29730 [Bacillus cereus]PEC24570.1 hypothetical protein CON75_28440 [Bacillus thuringiensis]PEQ70769.1 hypothetical protein CN478_29680 [Bacillus cereus]PFZ16091.1 hypothetical protein COL73_28040 [Bacillus thuringiensis]